MRKKDATSELRPLFWTLVVFVVACGAWVLHMQSVISIRHLGGAGNAVHRNSQRELATAHDASMLHGDDDVVEVHAPKKDKGQPGHAPAHHHHHHHNTPDKRHVDDARHQKIGTHDNRGSAPTKPNDDPAKGAHHHRRQVEDDTSHDRLATPAPQHQHQPALPHHHHHHHRLPGTHEGQKGETAIAHLGGKVAYAVVVSNEEFVDGALTLAWSFRNHSALFRSGHAELVLVAPRGKLCDESLDRLRAVGWRDQRLVEDLTKQAGQSTWAGTFNKLYLFGLTEYKRVAYFDVDMLMLRSPDDIFASHLPDETYIGALGNSHKKHKPYFQTGMMLIIPTKDAFETMMHDFHTRKENRGINGRDGVIVRRYYKERYVNIDDRLSAHLRVDENLDSVIGFHFRGSWKPWFDKSRAPATDPRKGPHAVEEREIGEAYFLWWSTYYDLHSTVLAKLPRPADAPSNYSAATSVWLMRHTSQSYVQTLPQASVAVVTFNTTDNTTSRWSDAAIEISLADETCDFVCGLRQSVCHEPTLLDSRLNNCDVLKAQFHCQECSAFAPHRAFPALDMKTHRCHVNPLVDVDRLPRCAELSGDRQRLCPCIPLGKLLPASTTPTSDGTSRASAVVPTCNRTSRAAWHDDSACRAYLADVANIESAMLAPSSSVIGVTVKLFVTFRDGVTRGIMKLPQRGFPHEPQSEVAAYQVDRLLGTLLVPPTVLVWVKLRWLERYVDSSMPGIPHQYNTQLDAKGGPRELVVDYCRNRTDVTRAVNGEVEVAVSLQLWMDDIHRFADSTLALPRDYEAWFGANALVADQGEYESVAADALPQLSDLMIFDYIIGNNDRVPSRNTFVLGGCKTYCRHGGTAAGVSSGEAHVVALDQGHAFYDAQEYVDVVSRAVRSSNADIFCRLRRTLFTTLQSLSAAVVDERSEEEDDQGVVKDTLHTKLLSRLAQLPEGTGASIQAALPEKVFSTMQGRLNAAVRFFSKCTANRTDVLWSA